MDLSRGAEAIASTSGGSRLWEDERGGTRRGVGMVARCAACGGGPVMDELHNAFGVDVCSRCKRLPAYDTIPKARAKSHYLVTDKELAGAGLKCLTRINPQNKAWTPMQLYLKSQVSAPAPPLWFSWKRLSCHLKGRALAYSLHGVPSIPTRERGYLFARLVSVRHPMGLVSREPRPRRGLGGGGLSGQRAAQAPC